MKSLLVSLLLFAFVQGAQAAPVELNEAHSKKLYNILATFGLRTPVPADMQTREWAHPALCVKEVNGGVHYTCLVHDEFHNNNVQKTGAVAKKLYHYLKWADGDSCEGSRCIARSPDIKCVYYWPNKHNPPIRRYACWVERTPSAN